MPTNKELMDQLKALDVLAQQGDAEAAKDAETLANILDSRMKLAPKPVGVGEDVARAIPAGAKQGVEGTIGGVEDIGQLGGSLAGKLAGFLGAGQDTIKAINQSGSRIISGALNPMSSISKGVRDIGGPDLTSLYSPSSEDAKGMIESAVPAAASLNYDPQTRAGKFAKTGTEFAVGALSPGGRGSMLRKGLEGVGSGLLAEGAGQLTEGSEFEPWARLIAGMGGPMLMSSATRFGPPTEAAQAQMDRGNPLSAGQATNSPGLLQAEGSLGGNRMQGLLERQRRNFTGQATETMGAPPGTQANPDEMLGQLNRIRGELDAIEPQVGRVPVSPAMQQEIMDAHANYRGAAAPNSRAPSVGDTERDIGALMRMNGGPVIDGPQLAKLRTDIRQRIESAGSDGQAATALRNMQEVIDRAIDTHTANTNPGLADRWRTARQQYRLYMDIEGAMARTPMGAFAEGAITPAALRGGVQGVEGNRRLVTGQSEFTDLAREGAAAMPQPKTSGTAENARAIGAATLAASGHPIAAASAVAGPNILGRALMSGPVQRHLMSQPDDARAALTALIAAQSSRRERGNRTRQ